MNSLPKLNLYTSSYPYGWGESYLNTELDYLQNEFESIELFPLYKKGELQKKFENNIKVSDVSIQKSPFSIVREYKVFKILMQEFSRSKKPMQFLKLWRYQRSLLLNAFDIAEYISNGNYKNHIHYSFWMNDWALALAILKSKNKIKDFAIRVNGFDIYDERHEAGFIPFRWFILSKVSKVFCVSDHAKDYLGNKFGFREKLRTLYFGTNDYGIAEFPQSKSVKVYSNARLIPLKNIMQIARVLSLLDRKVEWFHQGEGEGINEILEWVNQHSGAITFIHGKNILDYNEVIKKAKEFSPHFFISLSKSEGIPVSMIEAISLGIPLITTDVGGCKELINEDSGLLVSATPTDNEVLKIIEKLLESKLNSYEGHLKVKEFWSNNFSAKKNYSILAKELNNLEK